MNFSPHEYFCLAQYLLGDIWHSICSACHFGRNRGPAAILADYHHSTNRLHRLGQPLKRGGEPDPPSLGGTTPPKRGVPVNPSLGGVTTQPDYMISPPPRMGGSMPLPNEPKLSSKRTPIKGGWSPLDPLSDPLVGGDSNQEPMVERYHFQPSHPNGDTSPPTAATASYCDRRASTRS